MKEYLVEMHKHERDREPHITMRDFAEDAMEAVNRVHRYTSVFDFAEVTVKRIVIQVRSDAKFNGE